jgi:hypothetical protein
VISAGFGPPFGPVLQETVVVMTAIFGRSVKAYVHDSIGSGAASNSGTSDSPPRRRGPQVERARMSSPLAAVRLSIASEGSSRTVDPSVDASSPLRRHWSWMASA